MNILDAAYYAATSAVVSAGFPAFWLYTRWSGRYRRGFEERLGFVPRAVLSRLTIRPRLWIHAVSLGEIRVASAVARALMDRLGPCSILVSTATDHGFDSALRTFGAEIPVIYAPVDAGFSVQCALRRIRPDAMVFLETEVWPAWISRAHAMGMPTALVNGRISPRSFTGYRRLRPFFRHVLAGVDAFSMVGEVDAERIRDMGADSARVVVNGNAKYDLLASQVDPGAKDEMKRILNLAGTEPVLVAGSTRSGEEGPVLDAYERIREVFPETILVIAPRHTERARGIVALCEARGLECGLRSELDSHGVKRMTPVVILNTFGELFRLYSVADIVFCGGSLVPLGGQNPLEPAVWGKPVFYGPSMEDFPDAKALLEAYGAGETVTGSEMLAERVIHLLRTPSELEARGRRARDAVLGHGRAAERHARVVADLLDAAREPFGFPDLNA